jgi:hypothetical protein
MKIIKCYKKLSKFKIQIKVFFLKYNPRFQVQKEQSRSSVSMEMPRIFMVWKAQFKAGGHKKGYSILLVP